MAERAPAAWSAWRRLVPMVRPDAGLVAAAVLAGTLAGSARLFLPQAIRVVIDTRRMDLGLAALIVGVLSLEALGRFVEKLCFNSASAATVARLRCAVFDNVLRQEVSWFEDRQAGELTNRLMNDTQALETMLVDEVGTAARCLVVAAGGTAVLLWISPLLTGLTVLALLPMALLVNLLNRRMGAAYRRYGERLGELAGVATEHIIGVRTVRACDQESSVSRLFAEQARACVRAARGASRAHAATRAVSNVGGELVAVLVLAVALPAMIRGGLSTGAIASFVVTGMLTLDAFRDLAVCVTEARRCTGALERATEVLEREPRVPLASGQRPAAVAGYVAFEDVHFRYPSRPDVAVLEGVDLALAPGEVIALVGASGAGKSTLAGLLLRFHDADGGRVLLDGRDTRTLDGSWLRRRIGFVAQDPVLFSSTLAENIRFGREDASEEEVRAAARAANADEFVGRLRDGYATRVGERGVQLSGGQRQRIAIARAVLKDPRVLLLDEATSALDAESEFLVQQAIERLMEGRTTLLIAHRLSTVRRATRVAVLACGRVAELGSHEELVARGGLYAQLVERQMLAE